MGAYVTKAPIVVLLTALALLPACQSSSSSGGDDDTDTGTDAGCGALRKAEEGAGRH